MSFLQPRQGLDHVGIMLAQWSKADSIVLEVVENVAVDGGSTDLAELQ